MSAAPECLSAAVGDFSQFQMAQYPRHCKEEVLDPAYSAGGIVHNPNVPPVTSNGLAASAFNGAPVADTPPASSQPARKPKRSYTRKPSTGTKAKKIKTEPTVKTDGNATGQSQIGDHMPVQKKKRDRFKGTTEEEVLTRVLPDHIREDLDILIVGINPGLTAAYVQHHYAGPGNHFWKCLYLSGMIPEPMNALQDAELLNYGIGFTNIVARTTRGSADLTRKEIYEGGQILKQKMLKFLPKIALFNGKGIYEVFCGHKNFNFGLQPDPFPDCPDTCVFVNPSSSARCTQLPRAVDKVPFYEALKRVRDHIRVHGTIQGIDRTTVTFPDFKLVTAPQKVKKEVKTEPKEGEEGVDSSTQADSTQKPSVPTAAKTSKAKKPRVRAKKEKPTVTAAVSSAAQTPSAPPVTNQMTTSQQSYPHTAPLQQQPGLFPDSMRSMHNAPANGDFTIKQEVVDANQQDKDLAAIIQQSINVQQSMYQQQQQQQQQQHQQQQQQHQQQHQQQQQQQQQQLHLQQHQPLAGLPGTHSHPINVPNTGAVMMPVQAPSAVKQERPDWNGYGVMPSYASNTAPTSMNAYPPYSCYWNPYLPTTSSLMTNGYTTIPATQIAHQQAVAAAAALHTSVAASQANMTPATPAIASYNSPQEASSPAMSSQSNLTQASLDSLPKADSASTVANWLQSIPHS